MKKTKKLLLSLYSAGVVLGASTTAGCVTRTVYVYPDSTTTYTPPQATTSTPSDDSSVALDIVAGVLMGLSHAF